MKVYLAGGIYRLDDGPSIDWRRYARARLAEMGHEALDPMRRDFRGRERGNEVAIVHGDLSDIGASDAVIAMCLRPSWGTGMEIRIAFDLKRPVLAVVNDIDNVSPWLRYHATAGTYGSVVAACDWIKEHGPTRRCIRCRCALALGTALNWVRCMACAEADSDGVDE